MKILLHHYLLAALMLISSGLTAQNYLKGETYNITSDMTIAGKNFPDQCESCIFNISEGVILTINKDISVPNAVFNGGNIILNKEMKLWSSGSFNDVTVTLKNKGSFVSSAELAIDNSAFVFTGKSTAVFWAEVNVSNSRMTFLDNSSMEVTSKFNLGNNSALIAGDGAKNSNAFIDFNGGSLIESDNSYVALMSYNNYYRNWNPYMADGRSFVTKTSNINCGSPGTNKCDAPLVYGPATLNSAGVASSVILPVKLSAFTAKLTGVKAEIAWTSLMEINFDHYEIERSFDGINWSTAGTVKATGAGSIAAKYQFTDIVKAGGIINYRLKMIDIDGTFSYSPIKTVKAGASLEMRIFPNPATDYVVVSSKNSSDKLDIQVISQNGQVMKRANGTGRQTVAVRGFNPGIYVVRVADENGGSESFKLLVN